MRREISSITAKLQGTNIPKEVPTKVEQKVDTNNHIIILTNEDKYKVESVLIYSLSVGQEYSMTYEKELISEAILKDISALTKMVSYIFFIKPDMSIVPIKECIITEVEDKEDSIVMKLVIGNHEDDSIRKSHRFRNMVQDSQKLVFIGDFK